MVSFDVESSGRLAGLFFAVQPKQFKYVSVIFITDRFWLLKNFFDLTNTFQ